MGWQLLCQIIGQALAFQGDDYMDWWAFGPALTRAHLLEARGSLCVSPLHKHDRATAAGKGNQLRPAPNPNICLGAGYAMVVFREQHSSLARSTRRARTAGNIRKGNTHIELRKELLHEKPGSPV